MPDLARAPSQAALPQLAIAVSESEAEAHAAAPTLRFTLDLECRNGVAINAAMLTAQIRIAAAERSYDEHERQRLVEVFGAPEQWRSSLRSLFWTHATLVVPPFSGHTRVALLVACTYDFELASAKYLHNLADGLVSLEFLFSGSIFYRNGEGLLETARLSWEVEARHAMPVRVWREAMDQHFPGSAWLRVRRDTFDRLYAVKAARADATWEQTIEALLDGHPEAQRSPS